MRNLNLRKNNLISTEKQTENCWGDAIRAHVTGTIIDMEFKARIVPQLCNPKKGIILRYNFMELQKENNFIDILMHFFLPKAPLDENIN